MRAWLHVRGIERASASELEALEHIAHDGGWDPDELASIIALESGWDPAAHNAIRAGGLIGFLPSTLHRLGWDGTPEEFWALTIGAQLPWVRQFYRPWRNRIHRRGDLYVATFWPSAVGAGDDTVIAADEGPNELVWTQNPGLRDGSDGPITVGSVRRVVLGVMERAARLPRYIPDQGTGVGPVHPWAIVVVAMVWWFVRRRWHDDRNAP